MGWTFIGNTIVNRRGGGQSWSSYWTSHSDFWGIGRSGLTISDVHGNDAKILPSVMFANGAGWFFRSGLTVGAADSTGFIEALAYVDQTNYVTMFSSTSTTISTRYILFQIMDSGQVQIQLREPSGTVFTSAFRSTAALAIGWHKIRIATAGATYQITVDDTNVAGSFVSGSLVKWFADVNPAFRVNVGIGGRTQSNSTTIDTIGKIAWVNYNDTNRWICHGQGLYCHDNVGTVHLPWVGTPSYSYENVNSTFMLDYGFSIFKKTGELNEYVPNASLNTPIADANLTTYLSTYARYVDINGSTTQLNCAPSAIDFDYSDSGLLGNFDRSDVTIYGDAARTGHDYDAANTFRWRSDDIANPDIYYAWRNTGYKGGLFSKINDEDKVILMLEEITSFPTQLNGMAETKFIEYCEIENYFI